MDAFSCACQSPLRVTRQRGAVLIVSLIILVVITVIAAGSMRSTILEEHLCFTDTCLLNHVG